MASPQAAAAAARQDRAQRLGPPPGTEEVASLLAAREQFITGMLASGQSPNPQELQEFLGAVTGDLLGPCTAEGVPPRVAHIVRSSLESVGEGRSR